jgi:tetratricopeptide (TPR) repeat protein
MAALPGLRKLSLVAAVALVGATDAAAQSFFNNWARCNDSRFAPERRIEFCDRLLNNGGGPDAEVAVLTVLGGLYRDLHQYDKAIASYGQALQYEALGVSDTHESVMSRGSVIAMPTSGELVAPLEGRAEVYALTGKSDLALADAAHIFRLVPDAAGPYAIRCRIRAILKTDFDKALADCGQAMKLDPKDTQVLGAAGYLQFQMGRLKEAAADFDQALAVSPKLAGALYMRGVIRLKNGDTSGGNADIAAATAADPFIAESFSDIGVVIPAKAGTQ